MEIITPKGAKYLAQKKYRESHREKIREYRKIHAEEIHKKQREWHKRHPHHSTEEERAHRRDLYRKITPDKREKNRQRGQKYRNDHRKDVTIYMKRYHLEHRDRAREIRRIYIKRAEKENPKIHIDRRFGTIIGQCLHGKKAFRKWENLVGYTITDLMAHLEYLFTPEMSWDNYGSYWDIDHKKPKSLFHYTSPEDQEFKDCWALKNLQPLEHIENVRKSNHYTEGV